MVVVVIVVMEVIVGVLLVVVVVTVAVVVVVVVGGGGDGGRGGGGAGAQDYCQLSEFGCCIGVQRRRASIRRRTRSPTYETGVIGNAGGGASELDRRRLRGYRCLRFDV
jgi:hypothetical protein